MYFNLPLYIGKRTVVDCQICLKAACQSLSMVAQLLWVWVPQVTFSAPRLRHWLHPAHEMWRSGLKHAQTVCLHRHQIEWHWLPNETTWQEIYCEKHEELSRPNVQMQVKVASRSSRIRSLKHCNMDVAVVTVMTSLWPQGISITLIVTNVILQDNCKAAQLPAALSVTNPAGSCKVQTCISPETSACHHTPAYMP